FESVPLRPISFGGGQERGLRPGTLPVPLIVGFGEACALALDEADERNASNQLFKHRSLAALGGLPCSINGDIDRTIPHTINVSFEGIDSEAAILALKEVVAVSNGSACTSHSYEESHVLKAMGLSPQRVQGAVRFSWCHMTEEPDWETVVQRLAELG